MSLHHMLEIDDEAGLPPGFDEAHYDSVYHVIAANIRASLPEDYNLDSEHDFIEFYYEGDAQKICHQGNTGPRRIR